MPAIPAIIAAGASIGTASIAAKTSSGSSKRASDLQSKSDAAALQFQRDQDADNRRQFEQQQAESQRQWEAAEANRAAEFAASEEERMRRASMDDRGFAADEAYRAAQLGLAQAEFAERQAQYDAEQARRAPYRAAGQTALSKLGDLLGMQFPAGTATPSIQRTTRPTMPTAPAVTPSETTQKALDLMGGVTGNLAPTSENLDAYIAALNEAGIAAKRATRAGGVPSDDKIVLPDGQIIDAITDVGGAKAAWQGLVEAGGPNVGTVPLSTLTAPVLKKTPPIATAAPVATAPGPVDTPYAQVIPMRALLGRRLYRSPA